MPSSFVQNFGENTFRAMTVLVVEDDPGFRDMICEVLAMLGVGTIRKAPNGRAGFQLALREKPDLVLCDIRMRPGTGLEFLHNLRRVQNPEIAGTPCVLLTGDPAPELVAKAKALRPNGFLAKPVSMGQIRDHLLRAAPACEAEPDTTASERSQIIPPEMTRAAHC